ncbi:hypothetical protein CDL12_02748 [Handroanthus impetiginosus]|uniref:Transposase Tnp1/En/Spm-like domain-containing protein n=1 Tax=Handroanthus impetiginosus TaxID=429701 RepID=A0A2G9I443_9LAMI|nr:hypothetical protein CDL12_02748 [Handroanthus impetiginosus]
MERQLMQTLKDKVMRGKHELLRVKENTMNCLGQYSVLTSLLSSAQVQDARSCHEPTLNGLDGASRNDEDQEQNIEQNCFDPLKVVNEKFNKHKCLQFLKGSNFPKSTLNELGDTPSTKQRHAMNEKLKKQKDALVFKESKLDKTTLNVSGNAPSSKEPQVDGNQPKKKDITHHLMSNYQIKVGSQVNIFCHEIPKKIVGHGIVIGIICSEGEKAMHVKIYVEKILTPNATLLMPYKCAKTSGEVVHKCIDWELDNTMEM